jgi:hypothetical protein
MAPRLINAATGERLSIDGSFVLVRTRGPRATLAVDERARITRHNRVAEGVRRQASGVRDGSLAEHAEHAYAAYGACVGWKNFRGDPMPEWGDLPDRTRTAWIAAAAAVVQRVEGETRGRRDAAR